MSASLSFVVSDASLVSSVCSPFPFPLFIYISIYKERESGLTWVFYYYFFCNYYYYYHCCWKVELERKKSFNILKLLFWIFCESMGAVDSKKKKPANNNSKNWEQQQKKLCDRRNKKEQKVVFLILVLFLFLFFYFFIFFCRVDAGSTVAFKKSRLEKKHPKDVREKETKPD